MSAGEMELKMLDKADRIFRFAIKQNIIDAYAAGYQAGVHKGYQLGYKMGQVEQSNRNIILSSEVRLQIEQLLREKE